MIPQENKYDKMRRKIREQTGLEEDEIRKLLKTDEDVAQFYADIGKVSKIGTDYDDKVDDFDLEQYEKDEIDVVEEVKRRSIFDDKNRKLREEGKASYEQVNDSESSVSLDEFLDATEGLDDVNSYLDKDIDENEH